MKIHWKDEFKDDFKRVEASLKDPIPFRKALFRAISILQKDSDLSKKYAVNRLLVQGEGWYDCYLFEDIIMIYKIQGQSIKLSRLGTPRELYKQL